jgi:hypothetical protein
MTTENAAVADRIKALDAERSAIKEEALERAKVAIADLALLGHDYELVERGAGRRRAKVEVESEVVEEKRAPRAWAAVCPICQFQTTPPHDARSHRGQEEKGRFSAAELREKGLVKA